MRIEMRKQWPKRRRGFKTNTIQEPFGPLPSELDIEVAEAIALEVIQKQKGEKLWEAYSNSFSLPSA